jgi:hypothetical protein
VRYAHQRPAQIVRVEDDPLARCHLGRPFLASLDLVKGNVAAELSRAGRRLGDRQSRRRDRFALYATSSATHVANSRPSRRKTISTLNRPAILRPPLRVPRMSQR